MIEIDVTDLVLETKRLTLRAFKQEDLEDFNRYASVDGVGQPAGWIPHESLEESQRILDLFMEEKKILALVFEGRVIGSLGIEPAENTPYSFLEGKKYRALGSVLAKDHWGQGLMPEAVKEVLAYLFRELALDCVLGGYYTFNQRSARVFEKNGFTVIGSRVVTTKLGNEVELIDTILMRDTWEASQDLQS